MKMLTASVAALACLACYGVTVQATVLRSQPDEDGWRWRWESPGPKLGQVVSMPAVTSHPEAVEVPCEMFGGLLQASVSPTCCFSVNVVAQRGLQAFGVAKPCSEAWDCDHNGTIPTVAFERKAVQQMCGEERCVENAVAAMQANWMTARGADKLGAICEKTAGGAASNPYPSGQALKALLHGAPCDTQACKDACKADSCPNQAATDTFCAYDGRSATNVNHKCYETCCVPNSAASSGGGGMACFPGQAQVQTANGGLLEMSELRVGDEILVEAAEGRFELAPVLSFLHMVPAHKTDGYLALVHEHGLLRASENHVIFLCNGEVRSEKRAREIEVGDYLCSPVSIDSSASQVIKIEERQGARGMYAPLTSAGTIVVDGVVASNYATPNSLPIKHNVMHAALLPLRFYYSSGLDTTFAPIWSAVCGLFGWSAACTAESLELHPYVSFFHETAHLEKLGTLF